MKFKLARFELNQIYSGDCAMLMAELPPDCIDLVVTSPPYDNLRDYHGYTFDFESVAFQLYRVIKPGGVVVWVVADQTKNGSESGTSFRQALYFMKLGFNLHDTMIYKKQFYVPLTHNRYEQEFEYMFVFSKSSPQSFNPIKVKTILGGKKSTLTHRKTGDKPLRGTGYGKQRNHFRIIGNVFTYQPLRGSDHPAPFPEALARDHIISWSNPGDVILDPMCGSGTTCKMAKQNGRQFLGFDISEEYCEIARKRIQGAQPPLFVEVSCTEPTKPEVAQPELFNTETTP